VTPDVLPRSATRRCASSSPSGDSDGYYRETSVFTHDLYRVGEEFFWQPKPALPQLQPFPRMQLRVRGRMVNPEPNTARFLTPGSR